MRLRLKMFLIFGSVSIALFFVVNQSLSYFVTKDYASLEQREAKENVVRVMDALYGRLDDLSVKLGDWSQWDDTYQYAIDRNDKYVTSNLQNETFGILRINLVAIADENGGIFFKKFVKNGEDKPFPEGFSERLKKDDERGLINSHEAYKGIASLPEGVIAYAVRSVTSSDGMAPGKGFIAFGYFFDDEEVQKLTKVTHLPVQGVSLYGDQPLEGGFAEAKDHISSENPIFIADSGKENAISGYAAIDDADGNTAMLLRVQTDRTVFQKGRDSVVLFARLMAAVSVMFSLLAFFMLDRLVLKKVAYLIREVRKIQDEDKPDARILLPGNDEFSELAQEMNGMLEMMRESDMRQKRHIDETEQMNRLMVNRELKMIELKKEIRQLQQNGG